MRFFRSEPVGSSDPVAEIVARVWQTKVRSINLLEDWLPQSADFGIRAGLQAHLAEERRHLRLLTAEISRRDGRQLAAAVGTVLDRPFSIVREQTNELARVRLFHHGIKASSTHYCQRIMPFVDPALARVLEQITRDEERHIRWAEIRLSQDRGNPLPRVDRALDEIKMAMENVWSRPWRRLSQTTYGLGKAG